MADFFSGFDWVILTCLLLLAGIGGAIIASVAPEYFPSQVLFYLAGLGLFFLFSRLDFRIYPSISKFIYVSALVLLMVTLFLGLESRGAIRWIAIGPLRLQFSEIFKPFLVVCFADYLLKHPTRRFSELVKTLVFVAVPLFLVLKQPDLGSALVYFAGFAMMLFMSEVNLLPLFSLAGVAVLFLPFTWHFLADYQKQRLLSFISPHIDPLGSGYNAIQALITVGSGMLLGRGLGHGTQSHLLFLPEKHTDFIFAAISEELGFVGAALLLILYAVLILRIFKTARETDSPLGLLICAGVGGIILVQAFINVGMNLGILPVTGITLPLVSYGGSSILATMIGLGIVENVSVLSNRGRSGKITL